MSKSNDPGHFFQTEASLEDAARRKAKSQNNAGSPIRLSSKLLAVKPDPTQTNLIYVAESAGCVRRIDLQNPSTPPTTYTGPTAPLTSLTLTTDGTTLLAGSWDSSVWSWNARTRAPGTRYSGHSDFVKCVTSTRILARDGATPLDILITGSADASIGVWAVPSGAKLHSIRGHVRGVLDVAVEPSADKGTPAAFTLWSAGSDREIRRHRVSVERVDALPFPSLDAAPPAAVEDALLIHETSVNALAFAGGGNATGDEGVTLLTASSDKSAKLSTSHADGRWTPTAVLPHGDFVRAILPLHAGDTSGLVATGSRDEEVRVWDGEDTGETEPLATLSGHFDEVSALCVARVGGRSVLVSVGLDGTVRSWPADREGVVRFERERQKVDADGEGKKEGEGATKSVLTAEEEAELAELMEDDD